jgi:hypothetical protein
LERHITKLLRNAKLKVRANPEYIDYTAPRELDRAVIRQLMTG